MVTGKMSTKEIVGTVLVLIYAFYMLYLFGTIIVDVYYK